MDREGLEAAITQPAKRLNYDVEDRLLAEMLKDVETEENSLPLLQFALQQLWVERDKEQRRLTYGVYQGLAGVAFPQCQVNLTRLAIRRQPHSLFVRAASP